MPESIVQRVSRILNARLEDAVDRMERSGSAGVMREAIREVDRAIEQVRDDHATARSRRLLAVRQRNAFHDKAGALTEKARFAIAEGRDDLAEAALTRQVDFEANAVALEAVEAQAGEDEARLGESLAALAVRKREMEDALGAFLAARPAVAPRDDAAMEVGHGVERRVHRAEQAFDRAMGVAGGSTFARADGATIQRVAEIEVMQKRSMVAGRMAALKGDTEVV